MVRAVECKLQLEEVLTRVRGVRSSSRIVRLQQQSTIPTPPSTTTTTTTPTTVVDEDENHIALERSKTVLPLLVAIIQSMTADPDPDTRKLEEMLILNDDLSVLIRDTEAALGQFVSFINGNRY